MRSTARGRSSEAKGYRKLLASLQARLLSGEWPDGTFLPSLRSLAKEYGATFAAVRLAIEALKSEHRIGTTLHRRLVALQPDGASLTPDNLILEVMGTLLEMKCTGEANQALQRGIEYGVSNLHSPLLIAHDSHFRDHLPLAFVDRPVRGMALVGPLSAAVLKQYERLDVPKVLIDQPGHGFRLHSISADNVAAAYEATQRLLRLGHRRIALLRRILLSVRDVDPDSKERQKGFEKALRAAGIRTRPAVFNFLSDEKVDGPMMRSIFTSTPPFTAILCVDDDCGGRFVRAAQARGLSIPRDMSVAAFSPLSKRSVPWSGPQTDFESMGRRGVALLKEPRRPPQHLKIPAKWSEGETARALH